MALSTHSLFRRDSTDEDENPYSLVRDLSFRADAGAIVMEGRVEGKIRPCAMLVYNDRLPTAVNQDYDAYSFCSKVGEDGSFSVRIDGLEKGEFALNLAIRHANGAVSAMSLFYKSEGGDADTVAKILNGQVAAILAEGAIRRFDRTIMDAALERSKDSPKEISEKVAQLDAKLKEWEKIPLLGNVPAQDRTAYLSDYRWTGAEVGWLEPSAGTIPGGEPINIGGTVFKKGIYGHACSKYSYDLSGDWKKFSSVAGLQKGHDGSVVFVVLGDGRELFRSKTVRAGASIAVSAYVSGVDRLDLVVEDNCDGCDNDWGVWGDPKIER